MSPEARGVLNYEQACQDLLELSARLDKETKSFSDEYEHLEDFQAVLQYGEQALPVLLERMRREDGGGWWKMQAVWTIAAQYEQPIEFPEEMQSKYVDVKALILDWGKDQGYISREDLAAEPEK